MNRKKVNVGTEPTIIYSNTKVCFHIILNQKFHFELFSRIFDKIFEYYNIIYTYIIIS